MTDHLTCEIRTLDGVSLGVLVLAPKTFSSGKTGYFGQAKVLIEGRRYQCQAQLVAIASKPKPDLPGRQAGVTDEAGGAL